MKSYRFAIIVQKDEDGYSAYCPELQGCYTQGDTFEEVMANIKDAIRLHVEDRLASNEPIATSEMVSLSSLEVVV
ncbi:MAG: type II toxin-antitoxin system HicB family antitoxin [Chloroflexi bacterium]|nr:type II toxin-antitoxin system HicB family antitoxin [Chloroflexota bacterium]